jgi:hypothetical protein
MPDPTFVVEDKVYRKLAENANYRYPKGYLFAYILDPSVIIFKSLSRIAKENNLIPISFLPLHYKAIFYRRFSLLQKLGIRVVTSPSPENWIRGIDCASLVITDSFHGTVFSLILNTPFYSLINHQRGSARFIQLKESFDISECLLKSEDMYYEHLAIPCINWSMVNHANSELAKAAHSFFDDPTIY